MKKLLILAILPIYMITLVGCDNEDTASISGRYQMEIAAEHDYNIPSIAFDTEEDTFTFSMGVFSSYFGMGDFTIADNIITAVTYDDKPNTYIFEIVDGDTLSFDVSQSSNVHIIGENIVLPKDGNITFSKVPE